MFVSLIRNVFCHGGTTRRLASLLIISQPVKFWTVLLTNIKMMKMPDVCTYKIWLPWKLTILWIMMEVWLVFWILIFTQFWKSVIAYAIMPQTNWFYMYFCWDQCPSRHNVYTKWPVTVKTRPIIRKSRRIIYRNVEHPLVLYLQC